MQIYTSYFYQVRFMKPYMIPLSTAKYDPTWFHNNQGKEYVWKDKRGVYNGLRASVFAPGPTCENLCRGPQECKTQNPQLCSFLKAYRNQLDQLNYDDILIRCNRIATYIRSIEQFSEDPIIILLVHEAPNNPCSERKIIQEWFATHGKEVTEWR